MKNNKLPDNEIVKALECHSRPSNSCGSNCPYLMCEEVMCTKKLSKDALDLINRLQEENDTLCQRLKDMKKALFEQQAYTSKLQAENERLKGKKATKKVP